MKLLNFSILSLLLPFCLFASGQDVPKLSLSASAKIYKPADELQMKIGVITHAINAEDGLLENSTKMREIMDQLKIAGLDHDDYETNRFSINPTYTPRPKNPPHDWRQTINGYEIKNFILIHTDKLDMAGQIIDLANREGAIALPTSVLASALLETTGQRLSARLVSMLSKMLKQSLMQQESSWSESYRSP